MISGKSFIHDIRAAMRILRAPSFRLGKQRVVPFVRPNSIGLRVFVCSTTAF